MISTEKVRLENRDFIYSEGKSMIYLLFGVAFLFFGGLISYKYFTSAEKEFFLLMFGLTFSLVGIYTFTSWIIGIVVKIRVFVAKRRKVPLWDYDYKWNPSGATDKIRFVVFKRFFLLFLSGSFSITMGLLIDQKYQPEDNYSKPLFIALCISITVISVCKLVAVLLRYFKFGSSFLLFNRFPFFLGETVEAELVNSIANRQVDLFEVTLQCIVEMYETNYDSSKGKNVTSLVTYQVYADTKEVKSNENFLPVSFNLPDWDYQTSINSKAETRYWELVIKGKDEGPDYNATFLVPVYLKAE